MKIALRVISALLFIVGIIWLIVHPSFDALTAFLTAALTFFASFVVESKPDTETLDQRNRRILLAHVENFWVKGVLEKSLHGAAMLELGIKEDPEAVTYPWAIKKEATGETLPTDLSMLEIFEQIGMGRSLLILGAPGSGKTTMLLELARQLIERARQNETEPIPMVFNLASWTEKLSLADWLAQELNNLYMVPRKTAPDWVKGNKLLLLLDGLDEVRQESRAKCVDAINQFRKEHGLTSLAVCSRSQDYEELGAKLAFEGAIEVQPLTQKQVAEFFNRFGKEMAGLKSVLKKDSTLREMAETPLFLSIMIMAYRNKQDIEILDMEAQRKHLFDNYIEKMFERPRIKKPPFNKHDASHWLSWLAQKMIEQNQVCFFRDRIRSEWLMQKQQVIWYKLALSFIGLVVGFLVGLPWGFLVGLVWGLSCTLFISWIDIRIDDYLTKDAKFARTFGLIGGLIVGFFGAFFLALIGDILLGFNISQSNRLLIGLYFGQSWGFFGWLLYGGRSIFQHYTLRLILGINDSLPFRLIPFLDYCTNLIFLRRVGGGYIFVHRLLMEHFAAMYKEAK